MIEEKKTFYKTVNEDFPDGIYSANKDDALWSSQEAREMGQKAYIREVKLTEKEFDSFEEV